MPFSAHFVGNRLLTNYILRLAMSISRDFTNQNVMKFESTETEKGPGRESRHERGKNKVTDANATTTEAELCKSFKLR